jgi:hypothetical protein
MNFVLRLNIAICSLVCLLVFPCKAQKLASNKQLNEMYNEKTNEKLIEINKSVQFDKPPKQKQNLPSMQSSLMEVANLKMKSTRIHPHYDPKLTIEEKKSRLPGNSDKLKQLGKPSAKYQPLPVK